MSFSVYGNLLNSHRKQTQWIKYHCIPVISHLPMIIWMRYMLDVEYRAPETYLWWVMDLWCWEGLGAGGEGDDRGWYGWMASLTQWIWVWVNYGSWWQGGLECCNPWGRKESDTTELNWTHSHHHLAQKVHRREHGGSEKFTTRDGATQLLSGMYGVWPHTFFPLG